MMSIGTKMMTVMVMMMVLIMMKVKLIMIIIIMEKIYQFAVATTTLPPASKQP